MSIESIEERISKAEFNLADIDNKIRGLEKRRDQIDYRLIKLNRQLFNAKRS